MARLYGGAEGQAGGNGVQVEVPVQRHQRVDELFVATGARAAVVVTEGATHGAGDGVVDDAFVARQAFVEGVDEVKVGGAFGHFRAQAVAAEVSAKRGEVSDVMQQWVVIQALFDAEGVDAEVGSRVVRACGGNDGQGVFDKGADAGFVAAHEAVRAAVHEDEGV